MKIVDNNIRWQRKMADNAEEFELEAIEYLFHKGYMYSEIVKLLSANFGIEISLSTLKRRLKTLNLARKNVDFDLNSVRQALRELMDGPNSMVGYRSVWHTLQLNGVIVPRLVVEELQREVHPHGVESRKARRLRRRLSSSPVLSRFILTVTSVFREEF